MPTMRAMILDRPGVALRAARVVQPEPGPGQVLVRVLACAVCRTDLHLMDGELPDPKLPLIPGHEVVGAVAALGRGVDRFAEGDRVGISWLGWTCGECRFCRTERENLCERARFTGYTIDGGYAEYVVADARFCLPMPESYSAETAAPLLCAGVIGYRCLRLTGDAARVGLFGFGAAAHIAAQVARFEGRSVYAFTRPGDATAQAFARSLGATWAGDTLSAPPEPLDAAIIFAPAGDLVPVALRMLERGGCVVCGGIHMTDIPSFPYRELWHERRICSVANLTRNDGAAFLAIAPRAQVRTSVELFPLEGANEALARLRGGGLRGAAVLTGF